MGDAPSLRESPKPREFELLQVQSSIDAPRYDFLKRSGELDNYVKRMHVTALADKLMRHRAIAEIIEEPDPHDFRGGMYAMVRHFVGVAPQGAVAAFDAQLKAAKAEGLREGAAIAAQAAARYDEVIGGGCRFVIQGALYDLGRKLEAAAKAIERASESARKDGAS